MDGPRPQDQQDIEAWFVRRGVPHFIAHYDARTDIWTRSVPVLVVAYLAGGLNALDLARWSAARNAAVAVAVIGILAGAWAITNRLRRRPVLARPSVIGAPELTAFVVGPMLPPLLLGQGGDAVQSAVEGVVVLLVIYLGTSYGVVPLVRWAARRSVSQIAVLANLVVRALPLLLLFTTFLFINAEVWQVAGTLQGTPYVLTLAVFFVLGAVFVLSRVPTTMRGLATFTSWDDVRSHLDGTPVAGAALPEHGGPGAPSLSVRERFNIALVTVFSQSLQITFVALILTGFFVLFGFLAISADATQGWTALDEVRVLATWSTAGRDLVVTEPLLRVAAFLGAFTGMYFTVVLSTDATYREEFAEDVAPQVRQAFAVRAVYLWRRGQDGEAAA